MTPGTAPARSISITPKRPENEAFLARASISSSTKRSPATVVSSCRRSPTRWRCSSLPDLLGVPESETATFRRRMLESSETIGATDDKSALSHSPFEYLYATSRLRRRPAEPTRERCAHRRGLGHIPRRTEPERHRRRTRRPFCSPPEANHRATPWAAQYRSSPRTQRIQQRLRESCPDLIPNFIEECLRYESPIRGEAPRQATGEPGRRRYRHPATR